MPLSLTWAATCVVILTAIRRGWCIPGEALAGSLGLDESKLPASELQSKYQGSVRCLCEVAGKATAVGRLAPVLAAPSNAASETQCPSVKPRLQRAAISRIQLMHAARRADVQAPCHL